MRCRNSRNVREVDHLAVDDGRVLRHLVQPRLVAAPVEVVPGVYQLTQVGAGNSGVPVVAGERRLVPGDPEPVAQVVEAGLGDVDQEGPDAGVCGDVHGDTLAAVPDSSCPVRMASW
jgi:hypothetical protein